jgi:hypothetical protein
MLKATYDAEKAENLDIAEEVSTNMANFNGEVALDMV